MCFCTNRSISLIHQDQEDVEGIRRQLGRRKRLEWEPCVLECRDSQCQDVDFNGRHEVPMIKNICPCEPYSEYTADYTTYLRSIQPSLKNRINAGSSNSSNATRGILPAVDLCLRDQTRNTRVEQCMKNTIMLPKVHSRNAFIITNVS